MLPVTPHNIIVLQGWFETGDQIKRIDSCGAQMRLMRVCFYTAWYALGNWHLVVLQDRAAGQATA